MRFIFAFLSAIFASLTSILAKIGIDNVNSNLATFIRTFVALLMSLMMVFVSKSSSDISAISKKSRIFLILSGLATGASWLSYYKALKLADVSKVVPIDKLSLVFTIFIAFIFLGENLSKKAIIGSLLIVSGSLLMVL